MLHVRNAAVLDTPLTLASGLTPVPFDTVVHNTNGAAVLKTDVIEINNPGMYHASCEVVFENDTSAAIMTGIVLYADGEAVPGAVADISVPASGQASISLPWTVAVKAAQSGKASIGWRVLGAGASLVNAYAILWRMV